METDDLVADVDNLISAVKGLAIKSNKNAMPTEYKSPEEAERETRLRSASETLNKVESISQKYDKDPDYEALLKLADDDILMELPDILNNLEIREEYFEKNMAKNPLEFIAYYRQKLELSANYLYDTLQDLEAENKPGQFGQRLPGLFRKVRDHYSNDELPSDIRELLDAGNDINKLISATVQLALKFGAAHDLGLYIIITMAKKRNELIDNLSDLNSKIIETNEELAALSKEKEDIISEIEGRKRDIEELNSEIDKKNREILNIIGKLNKGVKMNSEKIESDAQEKEEPENEEEEENPESEDESEDGAESGTSDDDEDSMEDILKK